MYLKKKFNKFLIFTNTHTFILTANFTVWPKVILVIITYSYIFLDLSKQIYVLCIYNTHYVLFTRYSIICYYNTFFCYPSIPYTSMYYFTYYLHVKSYRLKTHEKILVIKIIKLKHCLFIIYRFHNILKYCFFFCV